MGLQSFYFYDEVVRVDTLTAKSGAIHTKLEPFLNQVGVVIGDSKNGQLLVSFTSMRHRHHKKSPLRAVPASCVTRVSYD